MTSESFRSITTIVSTARSGKSISAGTRAQVQTKRGVECTTSELHDLGRETFLLNTETNPKSCETEQKDWTLPWWIVTSLFLGLAVSFVASLLLLCADRTGWTLPERGYEFAIHNRASLQLIVQILSNAFALIWVSTACALLNYATRMWLQDKQVSLNTLRLWHGLCSRSLV